MFALFSGPAAVAPRLSATSVERSTRPSEQSPVMPSANKENIGFKNAGQIQIVETLQKRVLMDLKEDQDFPRIVGRFTMLRRGVWHDREQMCWAVLEPECGTLSLWDYPPSVEDRADLDSKELLSFSKSSSSKVSLGANCPPKLLKSLDLHTLINFDSNPYFKKIFLSFEGNMSYCLTAQSHVVFDEWTQNLGGYDMP